MHPTLREGYLVFTVKAKAIKKGDIIVYNNQKENICVVHRVDQTGSGYFYTRGDGMICRDSVPVNARQVLGKVVFVAPYLGLPVLFLKRWLGY